MEMSSQLYALTASRGAGKTAFCRALSEQARAAGWDVAGLLSPAVFEDEGKTGILAEALRTRETHPLAIANLQPSNLPTLQHGERGTNRQDNAFSLELGNWLFDPSIITWGNQILETCLPCDLFIVDELGPLELIRGEGWINALGALRQPHYRVGLIVIRPELLETVRQILPIMQVIALEPSNSPAQQVYFWWNRMRYTKD
jgi:nucleoside-triphosphatase